MITLIDVGPKTNGPYQVTPFKYGDVVFVFKYGVQIKIYVARKDTLISLGEKHGDVFRISTSLMAHQAWPIVDRLLREHGIAAEVTKETPMEVTATIISGPVFFDEANFLPPRQH